MGKHSMTREERRRFARQGKIFTACVVLACAIPGWVDAVLGWGRGL